MTEHLRSGSQLANPHQRPSLLSSYQDRNHQTFLNILHNPKRFMSPRGVSLGLQRVPMSILCGRCRGATSTSTLGQLSKTIHVAAMVHILVPKRGSYVCTLGSLFMQYYVATRTLGALAALGRSYCELVLQIKQFPL